MQSIVWIVQRPWVIQERIPELFQFFRMPVKADFSNAVDKGALLQEHISNRMALETWRPLYVTLQIAFYDASLLSGEPDIDGFDSIQLHWYVQTNNLNGTWTTTDARRRRTPERLAAIRQSCYSASINCIYLFHHVFPLRPRRCVSLPALPSPRAALSPRGGEWSNEIRTLFGKK